MVVAFSQHYKNDFGIESYGCPLNIPAPCRWLLNILRQFQGPVILVPKKSNGAMLTHAKPFCRTEEDRGSKSVSSLVVWHIGPVIAPDRLGEARCSSNDGSGALNAVDNLEVIYV